MARITAVIFLFGAFLISAVFSFSYYQNAGGWGWSSQDYNGIWSSVNVNNNGGRPYMGSSGGWTNVGVYNQPVAYGYNGIAPSWGNRGYNSGSSITTDTANIGGQHQNNVEIGGIQNFSGKPLVLPTSTQDAGNIDGSHQNIQRIGGILQF